MEPTYGSSTSSSNSGFPGIRALSFTNDSFCVRHSRLIVLYSGFSRVVRQNLVGVAWTASGELTFRRPEGEEKET